ncbi:unnamed protein product [Gongylonema pulchrum]|uniref:WD_REPEATS_REGION domain-containing protein n=1 Tax=Gongylonema pulchrum TaxID=637853 RepID=A0A183DTJ4_9BILA|nr:unnamed protein product [Gongylonema pulchrum]
MNLTFANNLEKQKNVNRKEERRDCVIEFWNTIGSPVFHIRTTALGSKSAESLLWAGDLLLASHLDGSITGHRLHTSEYWTSQLCPSPLWCLASISASAFCAGSDSGAVLLFALQDDWIASTKTISTGFDAHIMSLACNGTTIAAGTMDEIMLINVQKQRIEHTLKLPRVEKRKPTIVWCLCFIGDLLASGDSRGYITFWNPSDGAFSHADVLSMAVADETLYAAGVDPTIARLAPNQDRTAYRVEHRRTVHGNDVRALVASKHRPVLYSGGADYYFCSSSRLKHSNGLKNIVCNVAPDADLFSYQYTNRIVIWRTGIAAEDIASPRKGIYSLKCGPCPKPKR